MTRRAQDSVVSNNSLVSTIIIYPYVVLIYPWTNYGLSCVPFSVNHLSESKISAHFPQWFSEQLDNTGFILWSNNHSNNWSIVADCSGTVSAALPCYTNNLCV